MYAQTTIFCDKSSCLSSYIIYLFPYFISNKLNLKYNKALLRALNLILIKYSTNIYSYYIGYTPEIYMRLREFIFECLWGNIKRLLITDFVSQILVENKQIDLLTFQLELIKIRKMNFAIIYVKPEFVYE